MNTPIYDFLTAYAKSGTARLHMPGHKGRPRLGCEALDITEIAGADELYRAEGIIGESERNAGVCFGSGATYYATEGSSQCIRAMLYLALYARPAGREPLILAARNVHKSFVYAAALLDFRVAWLWPTESRSLCSCLVTPEALEQALDSLPTPPVAVYLTSPDYLGGMADIRALADICHRHGTWLLVDNAHGAYLHFLPTPCHPLDLGADLCCDSAHKTLPVLTGGAYLHLSSHLPPAFFEKTREALALFGSTSPSYLTLASLDLCNRSLAPDNKAFRSGLADTVEALSRLREELNRAGWHTLVSDPLRLTVRMPRGLSGHQVMDRLRRAGVEGEYADRDFLVLMATQENATVDLARLAAALGENTLPYGDACGEELSLPRPGGVQVMSVRQALFSVQETVAVEDSLGRICGAPTVSCPPAIPIAVSGERIGPEELELFRYYGISSVEVVRATEIFKETLIE